MAGLASLFEGYVDPQLLQQKQQMQFTQNLSQATDPRRFMATVGANLGQQLGGAAQGMFGGISTQDKIKQVLQSVSNIQDPLEQAQAAYKAFAAQGMAREAQLMMDRIDELKKSASDRALKQAQTDYYARRDGTTSSGSKGQTISMLNYIGDVRKRVLQGQEVSEAELAQAEDYRQQLMKQKSYTDDQGRVITIAQASVAPIPNPKAKPGTPATTEAGTPAPATGTTTTTGDTKVVETPASMERQQKLSAQRQSAIEGFKAGRQRIDEILANTDFTRGITGAMMGYIPGTEAYSQRKSLQTIVAKTVTETISTLKEQSKTGATGFGALNEKELEVIQTAITNLDPKDPRFDARLRELKAKWDAAIAKLEEAEAKAGNKPEEVKKERKPLSAFGG